MLKMVLSSPESPSVKAASKWLNRQVNMGKKKRVFWCNTPFEEELMQRHAWRVSVWFSLTPVMAAGRAAPTAASGLEPPPEAR